MLDLLLPYIRHMQPRALVPYQTFLKAQLNFIRRKYQRFYAAQGHEAPGIRLLRYILQFVDMDYLLTQSNNYERYSYHIRFIRKDLNNIFDRVQRGRGYRRTFIKGSTDTTEEFLMPVEDLNAIVNLPLHTEDWKVWKQVRPLHLWSHNSEEFTINLMSDRIRFRQDLPTYAVFMIDVVALVFKYFVWYTQERKFEIAQELAEYIPQQLFLHKYVFCPLAYDLANVWLINRLNHLLTIENKELLDRWVMSSSKAEEPEYGWIAGNYRQGMEFLWDLVKSTRGSLVPEALLSSSLLYNIDERFGRSLNGRIRMADEILPIPIQEQYDWFRYLRDRDLYRLFVHCWETRPDLPKTMSMHRVLMRLMRRLAIKKPWRICQSNTLKKWLEDDFEETLLLTENLARKT